MKKKQNTVRVKHRPRPKRRPPLSPSTALVLRAPVASGILPNPHEVPPVMPTGSSALLPEQPIITLSGLSQSAFSTKERLALLKDFDAVQVSIKPTGEVYIQHMHLRRRLSLVLGIGQWGLQPMAKPQVNDNQWMVMPWALFVRGNAISWTWGGARYQSSNKRASWSDALETTKSDALSRLCKDFPVGSQCWDERHNDRFKAEQCVLVYVTNKDGQTEVLWRTVDKRPFFGEKGIHPESPNRTRYEAPLAGAGQPTIDVEGSPQSSQTGTVRRITSDQIKRLLKIAREVGWKKSELIRYFTEMRKLKPAKGKPADMWHLSAVIVQGNHYDGIISDIQAGKQ